MLVFVGILILNAVSMIHNNNERKMRLAPKTVAVGLKLCKGYHKQRHQTGEKLFIVFRSVNLVHAWNNQTLGVALDKMKFVGFLRPHTLLISGAKEHMDSIKSAWAKRELQPPAGFQIIYFGKYVSSITVTCICLLSANI